ncbi:MULTISPECIES: helix-turn-helix domain-containing protein [Rhodococcus]|uniref:helix-turn-helix domain-containing protein n=1 Tax=Rhodococcus TaxID=1827 RepID=UPI001E28E663|nr:helix-turn-helix domain-containing protein [Rhodococcus pyridinivorans]MCD2119465.1 helix-turn-helix domain-containing protein [Rhodococcus pyridinivorans]MCZ4628372.1 helix-turn-helix domain-containing protein [Rhodococcus pyridinivorans]MCZ4649627.1 helix-turn-helix domain-containing protein [Rhodococcus pyridinivorans]MDJ0483911.1 helix-turn-helix domain-containing protein [Rhodococcus pyridinivorans]MDV7255677.1 helix-turn-helix domain-containing protein [Rhodococcus pyridinivorans]
MTECERWSDSTRKSTKPTVVSLDTRGLDSTEGRNLWANTVGTLYCESDVAWPNPRQPFIAEWGGHPIGELHVSTMRADVHSVIRSPAMVRSDDAGDFLVLVVTDGNVRVTQNGRSGVLEQGSFALLDCAAPFEFEAESNFRQVVIDTPRPLLEARLPQRVLEQGTGLPISGISGTGRLVSRFLLDVAEQDRTLPTRSAVSISSVALDLLVTALTDSATETDPTKISHARDLAEVQRIVERQLHDPALSLSRVAAEAGMSVRHIQNLFREQGTAPRAWLYRTRVERARKYLLSTDLTVAEVSEQSGFRDVSHFSRTFRAAYGSSPGRYRTEHR